MINTLTQFYLREFRPRFFGFLTKLLYSGKRIRIGYNFRADTVPRMLVDKGCLLSIGNNVQFRRNVEIRAHNTSQVIIEDDVRVDRGVRILAANRSKVEIGKKCRIGLYSVLNGGDSIKIGKDVLISGFVYIQTSMHGFTEREKSIQDQGYDHLPINIERDAWLGTHVVIMPGVKLGVGTVVGSNGVVTKSFEDYQIIAGVPAKQISQRQ